MIRNYHTHILQTNPWYGAEEPQNNNSHKTPDRQTKESNQLSLSHEGDCKSRQDTSNVQQNMAQTPQWKQQSTTSQQQQNCHLVVSSLNHRMEGGLNAFYSIQIFTLDSVVFKTRKLFTSHGSFLIIAIHRH